MYNPYEAILQEIKNLKSDVALVLERIPEEKSIKYYSPKEIAENTPLGIQTVRSRIKDGTIHAERIGNRKYMISAEEFHRVCKDAKSLKYKRTA